MRRPSVIPSITSNGDSNESCNNVEETDLEFIQCFFPTGMVLDVSVHPDDYINEIKQIVISSATSDGNLSLISFDKSEEN